ncbi:hypothetical protein Btru_073584 [Bulinus truncatus]|nr:hypothetical protein Btru_073584 [Bulinus truncatus]
MRTKHPEMNLNPQFDFQESQAATIIITTQTSNDGQCIATIEPFPVTTKKEIEDECETPIQLTFEDSHNKPAEAERNLRKRSQCWTIFKKVDDGKVSCSYCGKILALPCGNTSNLKRHLRLKHPGVHISLQAEEMERKKASKPIPKPRFDRISKSSISYFSVSQDCEMPQDMLRLMEEAREKLGFVPNVYQALSHRPNEMRAYVTYYETLMDDRNGSHLTKGDKEMIFIAVSAFNKCTYFIIAHSAYFRIFTHNRILADQIAANWETADLDDRQRSILQFAMKLTKCEQLMEKDFGDLQNYGLDREDAWDIGAVVSFCSLSNRMAFLTNMMPNEHFYSLSRIPQPDKV